MTTTARKPVSSMTRVELVNELEEYNETASAKVPFNPSMNKEALKGLVNAARGGSPSEAPVTEKADPPPDPEPEPQEAPAQAEEPQAPENSEGEWEAPSEPITHAEAPAEAPAAPEPTPATEEDDDEIRKALELHEQSRALVKSNPGSSLPAVEEFSAAMAVAERLANSKVVPSSYYGRPDDVLAAYLFGRELGLGIMTSLRDLYMIDGRASIAAHRQLGIIRAGGVRILESESNTERAFIKAQRTDTGEVMSVEFTMEQAKKVTRKGKPLVDGDNWKSYPEDMLWARCVGRLSRRLASDILGGSLPPYVAEEVADFEGWGVEYGSQGQLATRRGAPPSRQNQPAYNVPQSWTELRDRFVMNACPDQPDAAGVWFAQALHAVAPDAQSVREADKAARDKVWSACASTLYDLEQIGLEAIIFNEDPRGVIAQAFAKHLDGQVLEGPSWRVGPNEKDLPEYEGQGEVVDGEIVHEGGE